MTHIAHLKKGDVLVKEGDTSNSMYWLQSGTLRLFKKKGNGFVEIGVVHSGEVIGELSFLDNQPRSASVEALQNCDVVEIPRGKFDEVMATQPSWLKSLIHTLVKRLRTTNNRLREIESASTVYSTNEEGRTTKVHEFLSTNDILRLCSALILVGSRNAEKQVDGALKVKAAWFQIYGSHIFNVPMSKISVFLDLVQESQLVRIDKHKDHVDIYIPDIAGIERFLYWLQEEHSKPEDKQMQITSKGMAILNAIHEFGDLDSVPLGTEELNLNMEAIFKKCANANNLKTPFEWASFEELVTAGISQDVRASGEEKGALLNLVRFQKLYPHLALRERFRILNSQKRNE